MLQVAINALTDKNWGKLCQQTVAVQPYLLHKRGDLKVCHLLPPNALIALDARLIILEQGSSYSAVFLVRVLRPSDQLIEKLCKKFAYAIPLLSSGAAQLLCAHLVGQPVRGYGYINSPIEKDS